MSVLVERLPDQPIIIITYSGRVTVGDLQHAFARSCALIDPSETHLYRIFHINNIDVGFADVLHFAQTAASDMPGSFADRRFSVLMVGHDQWTKLFLQFMAQKQFGGMILPCFVSLGQALEYVQTETAQS